MKTKLSFTMLFVFLLSPFSFFLSSAQVPQGFNYQAIARDIDGKELANKSIQVKLTIKPDSSGTGIIWEELHNPVITNAFGLFTVVLGKGTRQGTSTVPAFSNINWSGAQLFIKTQVYYLSTWYNMGVTRLWSVPYAMSSGNISGSLKKLQVTGTEASLDSALFEVRNKDGQIVFAVYNEGVRVYVDDGDLGKGKKGGFAIGSFSKAKGYDDYFIVTGDSIRAYIDTGMVKARKGGFAIGSFSKAKAGREEYLRVTRDSTRVYIDDTGAKALKGGFAIGGFDKAKGILPQYLSVNPNRTTVQVNDSTKGFMVSNIQTGVSENFMDMTVENYFIGFQSGTKTIPGVGDIGKYNSFMGYQTGVKNITGKKNVYLGYQSGYESTDANYNVLIGNESGKLNATGDNNTFIGYWSGQNNNGNYNTFIGERAGNRNTTGTFNVYLGARTGMNTNTSTANYNTMLGSYSGYYSTDAANNVFIGYRSGMNNRTGDGNVFIGYEAGYVNKISNRLYIANSQSYPPLIFGEFDNKRVMINDTLPHAMTLYVNGPAGGTGAWQNLSDIRLKKNISSISDPLGKIMNMQGVEFEWNTTLVSDPGKHVGFIAQDMLKVVPEIVNTQGDYFSMQYAPITAILVEAFKIQQKTIGKQQEDIEMLKKANLELREQNMELFKYLDIIKAQIDTKMK